MKIEVQYFPLENCSGNLCKIVVETTDYGSAAQIVMNMFNIQKRLLKKVKMSLKKLGISCLDFPYFDSAGISAVGSYLNFLETDKHIFLPVFSDAQDETAVKRATEIFEKKIVAVNINGIAKDGGILNCISWETN